MTTSAPRPLFHGDADPSAASGLVAELYRQHGSTVLGLCRMLLRDPSEAEDAAQQTFLSAHRSLLAGNEPEHPAAWLATIARNECWGRIQQRMRRPVPEQLSAELASTLPQPLDTAVRGGDLAALFAAIRALPRQQRDALLLREFSGLSYAELAEVLSVSEPAVESLLVRARRELRARLQRTFAAGITPILLLRDWLSRLGDGGESSLGAVAKVGSVTLAAKVAVGAATLTVVGGSVVADGTELARPSSSAAARPPVRQQATLDGSRVAPAVPRARLRTDVGVAHQSRRGGHHEGRGSDGSGDGGGSRGSGSEGRERDAGVDESSGPVGPESGGGDGPSGRSSGPGSGDGADGGGSKSGRDGGGGGEAPTGTDSGDEKPDSGGPGGSGGSKSGSGEGGGEAPESGLGGGEASDDSGSGGESGPDGGSGSSGSGESSGSGGG